MTVVTLGHNKRDICIKMLKLVSYHILGYPGSFYLSTSIPGIVFFLSKMYEPPYLCLNDIYFQMLQHTYGHTIRKICKNISIWSTPLTVHPTPVKKSFVMHKFLFMFINIYSKQRETKVKHSHQQENLGSKERLCPAQKQQNTEVSVKTTNWSCLEAIKVHIRKEKLQARFCYWCPLCSSSL